MGRRHQSSEAAKTRDLINPQIPEIIRSCALIGHSSSLSYTNPQRGVAAHIDVIINLFNLDSLRIPASRATDFLDRAIGDYQRLETTLRRKSWNPFYWIRLGFFALLSLPFNVLGAVGFGDPREMERSVIGKLFKAVEVLVVFLAALLTVLSLLGFPTSHLIDRFKHH